jgi:hypothetical protein
VVFYEAMILKETFDLDLDAIEAAGTPRTRDAVGVKKWCQSSVDNRGARMRPPKSRRLKTPDGAGSIFKQGDGRWIGLVESVGPQLKPGRPSVGSQGGVRGA